MELNYFSWLALCSPQHTDIESPRHTELKVKNKSDLVKGFSTVSDRSLTLLKCLCSQRIFPAI